MAEFAKLSPQELLIETQRAVDGSKLVSWQNSLIQLQNSEKLASTNQETDALELELLKQRNARLGKADLSLLKSQV